MKWILVGLAVVWTIVGLVDAIPPSLSCNSEGDCAVKFKTWMCEEGEKEPYYCHNCTLGYTPNDAGTGCIKCESNCWLCTLKPSDKTKTDCTYCFSGYYIAAATKTCVDSTITNCLKANISGTTPICTECKPGNYLDNNECKSCDSTCKTCTSSACTGCYTSSPQWRLSSQNTKKCASCTSNCLICETGDNNDATLCTKCADNYYLDTAKVCQPCSDSLCKTCDSTTCSVCKITKYKPTTTSACAACGWKCDECTSQGLTNCGTCQSGYTNKPTTAIACDACPANCDVCSVTQAAVGTCTTCATGYIVDSTSSKCVSCSSGVAKCTSCSASSGVVTCIACETGYKLFNNVCRLCPTGCSSANCAYNATAYSVTFCGAACETGYTLTTDEQCASCGNCVACVWNSTVTPAQVACTCLSSGTPDVLDTTCTSNYQYRGCCGSGNGYACKSGFSYDDTTIVPSCKACSTAGCAHCNSTMVANECLLCDTTLSQTYASAPTTAASCYACSSINNCKACSTVTTGNGQFFQADTCNDGFFANNDTCTQCPTNCKLCSSSTTCSTCKTSNTAFGNKCIACNAAICGSCSVALDSNSVEQSTCASCVARYIFDSTQTGSETATCRACPSNCGTCELSGTNVICSANGCDTYYGRKDAETTSDKLCYPCPRNCTQCTDIGAGVLKCSNCQTKYVKNQEVCTPCPSNCKTCSINNGVADDTVRCTLCNPEYYKNGVDRCDKCLTNCLDCSSGSKCTKCKPGYGLTSSKEACTACATLANVPNCNNCTDDTAASTVDLYNSTCLGCSSSGFVLAANSSVCLSTSVFGGQCNMPWDRPAICKRCKITASLAEFSFGITCRAQCFTCGGDVNNPTGDSSCNSNVPATKKMCPRGCAWAKKKTSTGDFVYSKGCANLTYVAVTGSGNACARQGENAYCTCVTDNCNGYGIPDSACGVTVSFLLLAAALLLIRA